MTKEFIEKVLKYGTIDTKKYRYVVKVCADHEKQWREIRRLPLEWLDTTNALTGWETVARID